jgi:dTDP-4-amino-4,6-dideoxygalactose transaminase
VEQLALFGGAPVRTALFPNTVTTGEEELHAVTEVLKTGLISGFVGSPSPEFFGGRMVQELEKRWSERFEVGYSVSCNSATSALIMAVGAAGISPGDEVIVSPYTMSATATSILIYGGIPVFADIEPDCFCLDPLSVEKRITPRTKAILTTDIHGQPSDMEAINRLARKYNLKVIIDCAQAPGAKLNGKYAGTHGEIGLYSLNRHKNIQCGEGGIAVTNDPELALRMQLIRNHGENLVDKPGYSPKSIVNIVGFNFRMTEIEAAIAIEQLKKLDRLNQHRTELVEYLNEHLKEIEWLTLPKVRSGATHVYYMHVMLFDEVRAGFHRDRLIQALNAEGIPIRGGYLKPLYLEPMFQQKIAFGDKGFPFIGSHYDGNVDYSKGICPVAENYWERRSIVNPYVYPPLGMRDMKDIVAGFEKVMRNAKSL